MRLSVAEPLALSQIRAVLGIQQHFTPRAVCLPVAPLLVGPEEPYQQCRTFVSLHLDSLGHDIPQMLRFFREGLEYEVQDEDIIKTRIARVSGYRGLQLSWSVAGPSLAALERSRFI